MRFALVDTGKAHQQAGSVFGSGERLLIPADAAMEELVLGALRKP